MAAQRRLFLAHAGELAHLLARAVTPGGMAARFVRSYAERNKRQTLLGNGQQLREIESTIAREALLLMAIEVRRRVPRAFASGSRGTPRPEETAFAEAFAAEFLASLGRIVAGSPQPGGESGSFDEDLALYDRWTARPSPRTAAAGAVHAAESPFPDRCAMLLDPSMMEAARREAADFEIVLVRETARILEQLGRHGLRRDASPVRRARRPPRRAKKTGRPRHPVAKSSSTRKSPRPRKPSRSHKSPSRSRKSGPRRKR